MSQKNDNRIKEVIESAFKNLTEVLDVSTVMGKPYENTNGDLIVPVAKITFGILGGGGEYGKVNIFNKATDLPFSAGNGAIVNVKPCGFLIKSQNGDYKALSLSDNTIHNVMDKFVDFLMELKVK